MLQWHFQNSNLRVMNQSKWREVCWKVLGKQENEVRQSKRDKKNVTQTVRVWSIQRRLHCAEIKMAVKTFQRLQPEGSWVAEKAEKARWAWLQDCEKIGWNVFFTEATIGHVMWTRRKLSAGLWLIAWTSQKSGLVSKNKSLKAKMCF